MFEIDIKSSISTKYSGIQFSEKCASTTTYNENLELLSVLRDTAEIILEIYCNLREIQSSKPVRLFLQKSFKLKKSPDFQRCLHIAAMTYTKCIVQALRFSMKYNLVNEADILICLESLSISDVRPIKKLKVPDRQLLLPPTLTHVSWPAQALAYFIAEIYRSFLRFGLNLKN